MRVRMTMLPQLMVYVLAYLAIQVGKVDFIAIDVLCFQLMEVVVGAFDIVGTKEGSNRHLTCHMLCCHMG